MGTQRVPNEKDPSVVDPLGLSWHEDKISLSCLDCSSLRSKKFSFPHCTVHYFNSFVLFGQQAGQTVVLGRLSLNILSEWLPQKKREQDEAYSFLSDRKIISMWLCVSADKASWYGWWGRDWGGTVTM
jgi:hypothetical protein